uniref:AcidPPc domain-containing protein n=1 Tax=Caenorhabditis japonica TaxID=281687 RepID=A0A8R1EA77_CAEJA
MSVCAANAAYYFLADEIIRQLGTYQRGFFCIDPSIHYSAKPSTVSNVAHRVYNLSLTIVSILVVEGVRQFLGAPRALVYRIGTCKLPSYVVSVLTFVGYSQVGYIFNELMVKFVKGFVGRLRPNFYDTCRPLPISACDTNDPNVFVTDFTCTGDPLHVEESRKSFYSGHSTVAMYSAFWTVLYLQARLKPAIPNNVLVGILQFIVMTGGLFICCSRISDNKHHWSDVLVGILVGMGFAFSST